MRASALCLCAVLHGCATLPIPAPDPGSATPSGSAGVPQSPSSGPPSAMELDIVRYTNDARARNGLPALRINARLLEAARIHARQMADRQRMQHEISGAPYPDLKARITAAGYTYSRVAENIAWNAPHADSVVAGWMNSRRHRANILDGRLTEMGAAMVRSAKGEPYWIQVFGRPR